MKRRQFLTAAASVTFVPGASATPYQDAEYVRTLTSRLSEGFYDHGGIPILPVALRHVQHVKSALTGTDRELQTAASGLATWAAWVAKDAGRFDVAEHVGRLALALGKRAGDNKAQAVAYSALTQTNIDQQRLDQAVMYAKRGIALPEITLAQQGWLYMRLGRAFTRIGGQDHAAREAIAEAQNFAADVDHVVDAADLAGGIGEALGDLRAFDDAHTSLDRALTLSEQRSPRVYGVGLARQAKAALQVADPPFAADRMYGLAQIVPLIFSTGMDRRVSELLALSAQWRTVPEIHTAREQLRAMATTARA